MRSEVLPTLVSPITVTLRSRPMMETRDGAKSNGGEDQVKWSKQFLDDSEESAKTSPRGGVEGEQRPGEKSQIASKLNYLSLCGCSDAIFVLLHLGNMEG